VKMDAAIILKHLYVSTKLHGVISQRFVTLNHMLAKIQL
jgi:hypothetical protein